MARTDSARAWAFAIGIAALVALLTVPRLVINFGMDGDAIRGAVAAEDLVGTGVYVPSRLPGNPLFEYLLALTVPWGGHVAANLMVLAFFGASVWAFFRIARDRPYGNLLVALYALTPILVVNAVTTMDYLPGLAMLLWGYVYAREKREWLACLCVGLAIGFRLPNVMILLPLGLYWLLQGMPVRRIIALTLFGGAIGAAFYVPIFMKAGRQMFSVPPDAYHGLAYAAIAGYKLIMVSGLLANVGGAVLLLMAWPRIRDVVQEDCRKRSASFFLEAVTVLVFTAIFFLHPDESEYLIPALPFSYLLAARWLSSAQLLVASVLIVSYGFFAIELKGGESGRRHLAVRPSWGIVVRDYLDRKELEALRRGVAELASSGPAVIMHGYGPMLGYGNPVLEKAQSRDISPLLDPGGIDEDNFIHRIPGKKVFLVTGLSLPNVELLRKQGYTVYYFSESAPSHLMHSWGYDPGEMGLKRLEVLNERAFYRKNTPDTDRTR